MLHFRFRFKVCSLRHKQRSFYNTVGDTFCLLWVFCFFQVRLPTPWSFLLRPRVAIEERRCMLNSWKKLKTYQIFSYLEDWKAKTNTYGNEKLVLTRTIKFGMIVSNKPSTQIFRKCTYRYSFIWRTWNLHGEAAQSSKPLLW